MTKPESAVRILSVHSCPTISGKSKLTYHLGVVDSDVQIRVYANSGGGFFSKEWISLKSILKLLPANVPFTSRVLHEIFQGKSMNSAGFLLAVLKHEGLITSSKAKRRCWDRVDPKDFLSKVKAIIDSPADLKADDKPAIAGKLETKQRIPTKVIPRKIKPVRRS